MQKGNQKKTKAVMSMVRTHDVMNRFLEIELGKHGSNPSRFAVMNALLLHGGKMTPTEISKCRSVDIVVTEKGWKSTDDMLQIAEEISKEILFSLDEKEIDTLLDILKKIRKHLLIQLSTPQITPRSRRHRKS
ncbi:MAG: hypothetical protein P8175_13565 [Deltaproteobacteria bacterium]